MLNRIPEPHVLADAHYARLEEAWEASRRGRFCHDCEHCHVPEPDVRIPYEMLPFEVGSRIVEAMKLLGENVALDCCWCREMGDFVSATDAAGDCDHFKLDPSAE